MIAQGRSSDVSSLRRRLRGELDWIVLKALEKDRQRRYQSASEFANDLRKYLNHEPVEAGPPGVAYRLRKFVRRHRLGVTAATLVALALLGGAVVATVAMVHAQDSASRALGINQFMNDVLTSTNPDKGGANVQLAEVLGTASATVSQRFADHPELEAQVRELLGKVFMNLTMWAEAIAEMNQAHAIWVSVRGPDDQRTLNVQLLHARALTNQARHRDAERVLMDLAPRIERTLDPEHPLALDAQRSVGTNQWYLGRYDEAERTLRQAFLRAQRVGPDEPVRVGLMDAIVRMLQHQMRDAENDRVEPIRAELETLARELAERSARLVGPDSSPTLRARVALARAILQRGDFTAAAALAQDVMTASDQRLADCHDLRTEAVNVLTWARYRLGDSAQAADLKLMELQCRRSRSDPIGVLSSIYEAMPFLDQGGRWSEGEMLAREMSATLKDYGGGHGDMLLGAEACIARFVSLQGRLDEAELLFEPLLAQLKEAKVEGFVAARLNLFYGSHLARQGRYEAAEQRLQQAAQLLGPGRHGTWDTVPDDLIVAFTELYEAWGKPEKVAEYQPLRAQALSIVDAE